MQQNIDRIGRIVRGVVGIWLIVVAFAALRVQERTTAAIAGIAGLGLLQNATTGYCGGGQLFGIDTTNGDDDP